MTGAFGVGTIREQVEALGGMGRDRKDGTGGGIRKLAEARAAVSGKSYRTERRNVERALKAGRAAPAKDTSAVKEAGKAAARKARADRLRNARTISIGDEVPVVYVESDGTIRPEGTRDIGSYDAAELGEAVELAADLIEQGAPDSEAYDLLGVALLDAYGAGGGTLEIGDWSNLSFS